VEVRGKPSTKRLTTTDELSAGVRFGSKTGTRTQPVKPRVVATEETVLLPRRAPRRRSGRRYVCPTAMMGGNLVLRGAFAGCCPTEAFRCGSQPLRIAVARQLKVKAARRLRQLRWRSTELEMVEPGSVP